MICLLAIALLLLLLYTWQLTCRIRALEQEVCRLRLRMCAMMDVLRHWEDTFRDAAKIERWGDTGQVEERNWWE